MAKTEQVSSSSSRAIFVEKSLRTASAADEESKDSNPLQIQAGLKNATHFGLAFAKSTAFHRPQFA
jgi:hypothetical protein